MGSANNLRSHGGGAYGPSDWDQRHIVNLVAAYRWGRTTLGGLIHYNSGRPYVLYGDPGGAGALYSRRLPAFYQLDLRVDHRVYYDRFELDVYAELQNATRTRQVYALTWTGIPATSARRASAWCSRRSASAPSSERRLPAGGFPFRAGRRAAARPTLRGAGQAGTLCPRPMTVKRMDNVGVVVESLDAAISFFVALGLELEGRATIEGDWAGRVTGLRDQRVEIAMMRTPDGHGRLELSRFLAPPVVADHRRAPVNALGYLRVMFAVEDLDVTLARVRAHGAQLVGEVVQYEDTYRLCYIRGPEGLLIGLAEELG